MLTGLEAEYEAGSQVTALCTTAPAFPQPTIRWSINHKEVRLKQKLQQIN